jgi:hypothetical protein
MKVRGLIAIAMLEDLIECFEKRLIVPLLLKHLREPRVV